MNCHADMGCGKMAAKCIQFRQGLVKLGEDGYNAGFVWAVLRIIGQKHFANPSIQKFWLVAYSQIAYSNVNHQLRCCSKCLDSTQMHIDNVWLIAGRKSERSGDSSPLAQVADALTFILRKHLPAPTMIPCQDPLESPPCDIFPIKLTLFRKEFST